MRTSTDRSVIKGTVTRDLRFIITGSSQVPVRYVVEDVFVDWKHGSTIKEASSWEVIELSRDKVLQEGMRGVQG